MLVASTQAVSCILIAFLGVCCVIGVKSWTVNFKTMKAGCTFDLNLMVGNKSTEAKVDHGRFAGLNCNEEAAWGPQIWENALSAQPPDFTAAEARQSKTENRKPPPQKKELFICCRQQFSFQKSIKLW